MRTPTIAVCLILSGCSLSRDIDARGMSFEEFQQYQQVAAFANAGGDLDKPNSAGVTPLNDAFRRGYRQLAGFLMSRGANVNKTDANGSTPLHVVVGIGDLETARSLLGKGADANAVAGVVTPIELAVARTDVPMMKLLIAHQADPNLAPLEHCFRYGGSDENFGFNDPSAPDDTSKDRVLKFKALGWPPQCVRPPLAVAVEQGNLEITGLLLDAGARFRFGGWERELPVLLNAVNLRKPEMAEFLLSRGANPNERRRVLENKDNMTALHIAAAHGDLKIVELLVGKGADVNAKDNDGDTPLRYAEMGNIHKLIDVDDVAVVVRVGKEGETTQPSRRKPEPDAAHRAVIDYLRSRGGK
jgi:ankyrin repeat protein